MVFQSYALYPHMTVEANLAFGLKMRKMSRDEITTRVQDVAQVLGIDDLLQPQTAARFPVASGNGWPSGEPSCAIPTFSFSTNR